MNSRERQALRDEAEFAATPAGSRIVALEKALHNLEQHYMNLVQQFESMEGHDGIRVDGGQIYGPPSPVEEVFEEVEVDLCVKGEDGQPTGETETRKLLARHAGTTAKGTLVRLHGPRHGI